MPVWAADWISTSESLSYVLQDAQQFKRWPNSDLSFYFIYSAFLSSPEQGNGANCLSTIRHHHADDKFPVSSKPQHHRHENTLRGVVELIFWLAGTHLLVWTHERFLRSPPMSFLWFESINNCKRVTHSDTLGRCWTNVWTQWWCTEVESRSWWTPLCKNHAQWTSDIDNWQLNS